MIGKPGLKGREKERGKAFFDSKKGIMRRVFRHVPRGKLDSPLESFRFGWRERERCEEGEGRRQTELDYWSRTDGARPWKNITNDSQASLTSAILLQRANFLPFFLPCLPFSPQPRRRKLGLFDAKIHVKSVIRADSCFHCSFADHWPR